MRPEPDAMRIPLSSPDIGEEEIRAVTDVLRSSRLSLGPRLAAFQRAVAAYAGVRHAVAVSSGTAGLHLCALALGLQEGDEVITTPFSFIASANAIVYLRARPLFVDVDPRTLNIDPERIERAVTPRTRAILVVHVFGQPAPMESILEIAARYGLRVVEDACEALGGDCRGRKLGTLGDAGVYAFYPNKQITTGEGGMIVTNRDDVAACVASLRDQGRDPEDRDSSADLGYNYRLPEMACALGGEQMKRLDAILARREEVARLYHRRLAGMEDLVLPDLDVPEGKISWFAYVVRLSPRFSAADRDWIARELQARGIGCGRYFPPIHLQPFYRRTFGCRPGDFPVAEAAAERTLALPFFNRLTEAQVDEVCSALAGLCAARRKGKPAAPGAVCSAGPSAR